MSDESSLDGSEWHHEGEEVASWDSEDDLAVLMGQLCRVCGEESDDLMECFGDRAKEMLLVDKIHTHLPIMVTEEDLLPVNVCTTCVANIELCHKMVTNCLEADARMRKMLGFEMPPGYENLFNIDKEVNNESVNSSDEKNEKFQDDEDTVSIKKKKREVEKSMEEYEVPEEEKDIKREDRSSYRVILLKMKKADNVSAELQLQKALTFLKTGGEESTLKVISSAIPEQAVKTENSDDFSAPKEDHVASKKQTEDAYNDQKATNNWEDVNYECIYCDENIIGRTSFVAHQVEVHQNEVFSCDRCELVFEEKEDYKEHRKCHDEIGNSENLTEHINENGKRKIESEEKVIKKLKTDDFFPLDESVLRQIEAESDEVHWKCKIWQCKSCNEVSLTKQGWREHECNAQELVACPMCENRVHFASEDDLQRHIQYVHLEERVEEEIIEDKTDTETKYHCSTCGIMFDSAQEMTMHSKSHRGQFKCPHCERTFHRQTNLANHVRRHKIERGFTCRICLKTFANRGELLGHRRTHTREELLGLKPIILKNEDDPDAEESDVVLYKCPVCLIGFPTKQKLENHIPVHTDSSFPCHICGKVLSKKNTLEYHLRTHTGEKPYTCSLCPGAFQSRVGLTVHERIHTGEKPYSCDQCDMAFRCRATLNQHKVVHSEERPYQCTHCGRGFRRRDTLDTHIRTHTDERPYSCRICSRAFRQKGDCSKHEKTHNKHKSVVVLADPDDTELYSCPLCGAMFELKEDLDHHFDNDHSPEEKASSIVIINSENVITIPGIATVAEEGQSLVLHELS